MRALLVALVLAACGGRTPPARSPAAAVQDEIARAEAAERARRHDVARTHYERAIAIAQDPGSLAHARREFGETLASWGEIAEATAQLEASVKLVGDDPGAWHDLGMLRHKQGDVTGAIAALERARSLAPGDFRPRVSLGVIRWKHGDLAGALAEYRELLELELPDRLREKVKWAIGELSARVAKP